MPSAVGLDEVWQDSYGHESVPVEFGGYMWLL